MEQIVLAIHAAVCVVEPRYTHRLLARVLLRRLCTDHMYLATHFNTVVKCVHRVSSMVPFTAAVNLSLVNAISATDSIWILHLGTGNNVVVRVLDTDSSFLTTSLQRCEGLVLGVSLVASKGGVF